MEWTVVNPVQVQNTFASLGTQDGDSYNVSGDCLTILGEILGKLSLEDRTLRTFRRSLGFSQVIKKDLLPILINIKDDFRITNATIRILVNLTVPVECLLPMEVMSKTDAGRHTILELNKLLMSGKEAFVDARSTRAIVDHMKQVLEKGEILSEEECESVNHCLLLLRNILHIPEPRNSQSGCSMQNQILWNLFTQSIDKILIHLMTCAQKTYWVVTMVQLIAIMYKDQHVGTLQKLLNTWFEASLSESSEDNESNTSPPDQGSGGESPMLTSDPTSDSSDNGSSRKNNRLQSLGSSKSEMDYQESDSDGAAVKQYSRLQSTSESSKSSGKSSADSGRKSQTSSASSRKSSAGKCKKDRSNEGDTSLGNSYLNHMDTKAPPSHPLHTSRQSSSELSDYGYATQVENQGSISTSSNEDECPQSKRPVHQKPHTMQKSRHNKPFSTIQDKKEWRRKKLVKRSRTNMMNVKALLHHVPTDEDISNLLKEFTVDFLLKGYGSLVQELHIQLLNNKQELQVDTSHFFWLVTYFLKFATQLELELEHISSVLCFEIVSYLTYEGVNLCEQLELISQQSGSDLKPCLRRMHLVVTAIREFIQAVQTYRKMSHLGKEDREHLLQLQLQIGSTEDLKCLFVLLLRQFNPNLQSKQYLQDLVVTNHILLLFLDNVGKLPEYKGNTNMMEHIKQFATVEVMHQYGLVLEDFQSNGEFINDCVFTMMHHIGGDLEQVAALFQPSILKTFSQIWETEYDVCDDWSDLIEYVIHKFINSPRQSTFPMHFTPGNSDGSENIGCISDQNTTGWTKDDLDNLYWFYIQSMQYPDPVGRVQELYIESRPMNKTRIGIIQQLFTQDVINRVQYDELMKVETVKSAQSILETKSSFDKMVHAMIESDKEESGGETAAQASDRISVLRDHLLKEKKGKLITWLQKLLIEACYVKLNMDKLMSPPKNMITMEPVPHHYTLMNQSIPVVPWNSDQKNSLLYQPFILLLHKLGFHFPVDSGKVFVRIPNFWTPDVLFSIAQQLGPINKSSLKFDTKMVKKTCGITTTSDTNPVSRNCDNTNFAVQQVPHSSSVIRSSPLPNSTSNWMQIVIQSNGSSGSLTQAPLSPTVFSVPVPLSQAQEGSRPCGERNSDCSVCETGEGSVASDLTRMCVSDEDERDGHISSASMI